MAKSKKTSDTNEIGSEAELLVQYILRSRTVDGYLFDTVHLGGKWPTIDLYVELREGHYATAFCFIQVKGSTNGIDERGMVRCSVSKDDMKRLANFHAPCYIVSVDASSHDSAKWEAYIVSTVGVQKSLTNIQALFPLRENLKNLFDEVTEFWKEMNVVERKKNFRSKFST